MRNHYLLLIDDVFIHSDRSKCSKKHDNDKNTKSNFVIILWHAHLLWLHAQIKLNTRTHFLELAKVYSFFSN
jgi:hypothetical protein